MPPKQQPGKSKQDYVTPKNFMDAVTQRLEIASFTVDLAADASNSQGVTYLYEQANSLIQPWEQLLDGGWGWLNPPYAKIGPWVEKCLVESIKGAKIACLVPASVGANWYRDYVHNKAYVLFLNGRLAFIPDKPKWLYPKDLMLILYNQWARGSDVWTWRA